MTPEDVITEYSDSKSDVKIKVIELDNDCILIEGTSESLRFLSKLILAQAEAKDDGIHISPIGPGSDWFSSGSTKGIYIHRIGDLG